MTHVRFRLSFPANALARSLLYTCWIYNMKATFGNLFLEKLLFLSVNIIQPT